jgi:DNA-binding GntR family transcriptional regulator
VGVEIDHGSEDFPFEQLAAYFRERIRSGADAPGTKLPSIGQLVAQTGLSPKTIQHAMRTLADEGLVTVRPNRGTFVARLEVSCGNS